MLSLSKQEIIDTKKALQLCIKLCLNSKPEQSDVDDINKLYDMIYPYDKAEDLIKDINIIRQGKALFEDDTRELTTEEISRMEQYVQNNLYNLQDLDWTKKLLKKLITVKPECKHLENRLGVKRKIAIILPRREDQK